MSAMKISKVDLLAFISVVLAVVIALSISIKYEQLMGSRKENSTNANAFVGKGHGRRATGSGRANGWHDGYGDDDDDRGPKYPFFWYYKIGIPAIFTAQDAIERELEELAKHQANFPSIASKGDQTENDIVSSTGQIINNQVSI